MDWTAHGTSQHPEETRSMSRSHILSWKTTTGCGTRTWEDHVIAHTIMLRYSSLRMWKLFEDQRKICFSFLCTETLAWLCTGYFPRLCEKDFHYLLVYSGRCSDNTKIGHDYLHPSVFSRSQFLIIFSHLRVYCVHSYLTDIWTNFNLCFMGTSYLNALNTKVPTGI